MKTLISPSILSANFANIGNAVIELQNCGADMLHCDVMDGIFVPNITFGMKMLADIKNLVNIPLDAHLMIINPENYVDQFALAGADYITIHLEATKYVAKTLRRIRELGVKAGLSIKPNTPVSKLKPYIDDVDLILIMSVEPGFGGQKFIETSIGKIAETKALIGDRNIIIQVDGGINLDNCKACVKAGANSLVAGNTVFKAVNKADTIAKLRADKL